MQIELTKPRVLESSYIDKEWPIGSRFRGCRFYQDTQDALVVTGHGQHSIVPADSYVIVRERRYEVRFDPITGEEVSLSPPSKKECENDQ